jgi:threonylcarbamoyladenosine tRNA methylthiotransferase MtaB
VRADVFQLCETLRRVRPDIVFGADLIAGFPTETDDMHQRTLDLVAACELTYLHVFAYSVRPGTPAARMPPVAPDVIAARARDLRGLGQQRLERFLASQVGTSAGILMEKGGTGRTPQFAEVALADPPPAGTLARVRLCGHDGRRLTGEAVAPAQQPHETTRIGL